MNITGTIAGIIGSLMFGKTTGSEDGVIAVNTGAPPLIDDRRRFVVSPTARKVKQYAASGSANFNLVTDGGTMCQQIVPMADGTITVTYLDDTTDTIDVVANVPEPVRAKAITGNTPKLKVYW
jgi:hypothetical protein